MQLPPTLPEGVTMDDVEIVTKEGTENDIEPQIVARNKKTGEIYE